MSILAGLAIAAAGSVTLAAAGTRTVLPSGWRLSLPAQPARTLGDMPQGMALSPDGLQLAIVESGVALPALRVLDSASLAVRAVIPLKGAFGKPVWLDADHVLVPGANEGALLRVDLQTKTDSELFAQSGSWPEAVALSRDRKHLAIGDDALGTVTLGSVDGAAAGAPVRVGMHPGDLLFSRDGTVLFVALRGANSVIAVNTASHAINSIAVGRHPSALALSDDGSKLFVAESDDDAVAIVDTRTRSRIADIAVGLHDGRLSGPGASPNALTLHGSDLFVALGAENAVALVRNRRVFERIPAGWYPTGVALTRSGTLLILNGKGESAPANPQFNSLSRGSGGYVGVITTGSLREVPRAAYGAASTQTGRVLTDAMPQWTPAPQNATILRANGPIRHVIYVIKENRSYDQVLGDIHGANGDSKLTIFGQKITPNQHALARRFGVFDNAYTNAEVSADGHNWTDAAFANDYLERFWPPNYGGRRTLYDFQNGGAPEVPHNGYLWDAAARAHITYRDYGEDTEPANHPALQGHYDPAYVGWNLRYGDLLRLAEWEREFRGFVAHRNLPQFEIVYLPNDHTSGTSPHVLTPFAYVATNDWAVGRLVDAVSHSPYWKSTAIFVLEDDAQNGPDHVSDQRSTFYVASPYALGGIQHDHYSTVSFVRTMELLLGLRSLSIYDATARPLYDAFGTSASNAAPFVATKPDIDLTQTNAKAAYGSAISARLNFTVPDAIDPRVLNAILARAPRPR